MDLFKQGYQLGMTGEPLDYPKELTPEQRELYHEGWVEGISHKLCQLVSAKQSKDKKSKE
jgi:ribosome modulation factor